MSLANSQFKNQLVYANKFAGTGSAPSIAAGTGAGTSPTVSVSGTDSAGTITITTGSTPAGSNATIATITFASGSWASAPFVGLSPANAAAAALSGTTNCFVDSASTTTSAFVLKSGSAALTAATTYIFTYDCTG